MPGLNPKCPEQRVQIGNTTDKTIKNLHRGEKRPYTNNSETGVALNTDKTKEQYLQKWEE